MEVVSGVGTLLAALAGWGVRLESRISVQKALHESYVESQEDEKESIKELINVQFIAVHQRLDRIERSMNGHYARE
jgi:hypothetical protein